MDSDFSGSESEDWDIESPTPVKVKSKSKLLKKVPNKKPLVERNIDIEANANGGDGGESKKKNLSVEDIYQKKTQLEHILLRPDTYIGSTEPLTQQMWVWDAIDEKMKQKEITFTPGLYKIFDEILVNAADNKQRDASMNRIKVEINQEEGYISVENNGNGIPVQLHKEHGVYIPEMIFGQLLTSSNYDDSKKKVTGGRNGFGAKLTNIFSKEFTLETSDKSNKKKFKITWSKNMSVKSEPKISKNTGSDFTKVIFKPDFQRFNMTHLDNDIVALMSKRVYDMAGITPHDVKVHLNDKKINVKKFNDYVDLYMKSSTPVGEEPMKLYVSPHPRWEIVVSCSEGQFEQVSFVNSICTTKGGQHVNYVADQITKQVVELIDKKHKGNKVKPFQVKAHLKIFVNALIENPAFDSQTKETLTTRSSQFGSKPILEPSFMKKILKSELVERVLSWSKFKQNVDLKRKGGKKKIKLTGIPKLDDANYAGSAARSKDCTLILTEGDSAKALAVAGLSVVGRDLYGVFPLKGKLLNVRDATHSQHLKNAEIQNLVNILGLKYGTKYENTKSLRYGHVLIMTDQDADGSHIKALLINFFHSFWPSLLEIRGFVQQFITPIVKATKGRDSKTFFTLPEYLEWKNSNSNSKTFKIKYYKGLGTSTSAEAKEYFSDLDTHLIDFQWDGDEAGGNLIDMAFNKKRTEDRKTWLSSYVEGTHAHYDCESVTYSDFINEELILFSMADNIRSIPSWVDGLKPSQRKVLFSCFKRNLKNEIKVAQLSGYVSEHSAYHHGEASLASTIVNMAQTFVGSNNINLLYPAGQFGTRILGGKDAASPRYIFTKLMKITRAIFHPDDDALLNYLDEDGQTIEPSWYIPVIPMVLVNGADGIGTGWSTKIPNFNPVDIISNLRRMISGEDMEDMQPWYRGYNGSIEKKEAVASSRRRITTPVDKPDTYIVRGKIDMIDDTTLRITELPLKKWTQDYKVFLESMLSGESEKDKLPFIRDFKENHTETHVDFTVILEPSKMKAALEVGLEDKFKLASTITISNFTGFNKDGTIRQMKGPKDVMQEFFDIRCVYYEKRKQFLEEKLHEEWDKISNKVRFILEVINGSLVISNVRKVVIIKTLASRGYKQIVAASTSSKNKQSNKSSSDSESNDSDIDDDEGVIPAKAYDYLLSMKLWSLTHEKVETLKVELATKESELNDLRGKSPFDLWEADLSVLEEALQELEVEDNARDASDKKIKRKAKKKLKMINDDEDWDAPVSRAKPAVKPKKKTGKKTSAAAAILKPKPNNFTSIATSAVPKAKKALKKPSKPVVVMKDEEDEEILSLAERLASRMHVTPQEVKSKSMQSKPKTKTFVPSDDDIVEMASDSDEPIVKKKASKPKKSTVPSKRVRSVPASKSKVGTKARGKATKTSNGLSSNPSETVDVASPAFFVSPELKRTKVTKKTKSKSKSIEVESAIMKPKKKNKTNNKKKVVLEDEATTDDSSDSDGDDFNVTANARPVRKRQTRTRKVVSNYCEIEESCSDEEEDVISLDEEEDGSCSEEFELSDGDEDFSDFE